MKRRQFIDITVQNAEVPHAPDKHQINKIIFKRDLYARKNLVIAELQLYKLRLMGILMESHGRQLYF